MIHSFDYYIFWHFSEGHKVVSLKGSDTFHGHSLSGNLRKYHYAKNKLLDQLMNCLTERFEDDQEILRATVLANLRRWPKIITSEPGNQFIKG